MVFREAEILLGYFRESQDPYVEDYESGKFGLLARAIEQIRRRFGTSSIFFVEDTSVRIDALSELEDVPGLRVKEWFRETSFADLDIALRSKGNDRRATVSSDIGIFVPGLGRPVFVNGNTQGSVAHTEPAFSMNEEYPWLTPNTFNGWFIPIGSSLRLGEMAIDESLDFDFRVKALRQVVERIQEYNAVLNLSSGSYVLPHDDSVHGQPLLFPASPLLVVVGRVCGGKTTFANFAAGAFGRHHVEASDEMHGLAAASKIDAPTAAEKARILLSRMGADVVAREIEALYGSSLDYGAVITGFRTLEEVRYIRERHPSCRVVFVDCGDRLRYERHLSRGRGVDEAGNYEDFLALDRAQWTFGLLGRVGDVCDLKVVNEGSMEEYERMVEAVAEGAYYRVRGVSVVNRDAEKLREARLFRCLRALAELDREASCEDISVLTGRTTASDSMRSAGVVSPRHANWILKDVPEFARRVERKGKPVHYEILPPGLSYLKLVGFNAWAFGDPREEG